MNDAFQCAYFILLPIAKTQKYNPCPDEQSCHGKETHRGMGGKEKHEHVHFLNKTVFFKFIV